MIRTVWYSGKGKTMETGKNRGCWKVGRDVLSEQNIFKAVKMPCLIIFWLHYACMRARKVIQPCLTLCDPMDCSPPGFSVHEVLQTRILEWVAMPSSRGSSRPRDWTSSLRRLHWQVLYHWCHLGSHFAFELNLIFWRNCYFTQIFLDKIGKHRKGRKKGKSPL